MAIAIESVNGDIQPPDWHTEVVDCVYDDATSKHA